MPIRWRSRPAGLGSAITCGSGAEKKKPADATSRRFLPTLLKPLWRRFISTEAWYPARELLKKTVLVQASEDGERISESDRKSALQEFLQGKGGQLAEYRLAGESGPDHQKTFLVQVWVKGECMSSAEGSTKKEAEQKAARQALEKLRQAELKARKGRGWAECRMRR